MERIYTNHRPNERRIHIEIDENEIAQLVTSPNSDASRQLAEILADAHCRFQGDPS